MIYPITLLLITYLISSIPFGLVISKKFAKKDIRQHGSNNIGATNVTRVLGKKLGIATLILDSLKGAIMVIIANCIFFDLDNSGLLITLVAATAVIGHVFPIYIKFKGGKGVATTLAVLLALNIVLGAIACLSWLIIFLITRTSSASSLGSILLTFIYSINFDVSQEEVALCLFLTILIFIRHKENIIRLFKGEEIKLNK